MLYLMMTAPASGRRYKLKQSTSLISQRFYHTLLYLAYTQCWCHVMIQVTDNGQAADVIYNDHIHILVNMNGYTKGARNEIFALKPAPIQVMWLGYPGTSGANYMDYIITDRITSPLQYAEHYSEKLAYMPHTFFVGDHKYMFPHLLNAGSGTNDPEVLKCLDSQAGVIKISDKIQQPTNASLVSQSQAQQQQQLKQQQIQMEQQISAQQQLLLQTQSNPAVCASVSGLHQRMVVQANITSLQQQLQQIKTLQLQYQQQQQPPQQPPPPQTPQEATSPKVPADLPLTTRAQYGLPDNTIVYCNFNQLYKIDPATLKSWVNILLRVPNSVLWLLKFPASGESNILNSAIKLGLTQGRIIFSAVAPKEEHVRRGRLADLCLDTPLCNGHTTGMSLFVSHQPMMMASW